MVARKELKMEPDYDYEIRKVSKTPEEQAHILRENIKKILKGNS